ncbi:MAG TPA: hypothetical protein VGN92_16325, partial [Mycobacterium sp.]|nr:hypothetical protein [Mycobacterium sp.]
YLIVGRRVYLRRGGFMSSRVFSESARSAPRRAGMAGSLTMLTGAGAFLTAVLHTGTTLLAAPVALAATTALVLVVRL